MDATRKSRRVLKHNPERAQKAICLECSGRPDPKGRDNRLFCGSVCRIRFNQRRLTRGATLYDLVMAMHDPTLSRSQKHVAEKALRVIMNTFWTDDRAQGGPARYKPVDFLLGELTGSACRLTSSSKAHPSSR